VISSFSDVAESDISIIYISSIEKEIERKRRSERERMGGREGGREGEGGEVVKM